MNLLLTSSIGYRRGGKRKITVAQNPTENQRVNCTLISALSARKRKNGTTKKAIAEHT